MREKVIEIIEQTKEGFWLYGFFVVLAEGVAYYKDNEGVWRYFPIQGG